MKKYTTKEVQNLLGISKETWKRRKEEILLYLSFFWKYSVREEGRSICYIIEEEYGELAPLPRKSKTKEIQAFYANEADHILTYKPRNTGTNIAREIEHCNNKYEHATGTIANYIRPYLKKNYTVDNRQWCEIDYENFTYNPISDIQLKFLKDQFKKYLTSENIADAIADQEAGYTTKEEAYDCLKGYYTDALNAFKDEYGFRPYKAGELIKNAWVIED